jgi:hypothetical protein
MKPLPRLFSGLFVNVRSQLIAIVMLSLSLVQGYAQYSPVPIGDTPNGIIGNSPLREGETLYLAAQGGISYEWSGPNGFTSDQAVVEIPGITPSDTGIYSVTVTSLYVDTLAVYSINVTLKPAVPICLGAANYEVCINSPLELYSNTYFPTYTYAWWTTIPNVTIPQVPNPGQVQIPDGTTPGTYYVYLAIFDGGKQICSDYITIKIYDCCLDPGNVNPVSILYNETTINPSLVFTDHTVILGTLIVPANFSIPGNVGEITLLPNSGVLVYDAILSAANVDFHGCHNLWRSIVLNESSIVQFSNTCTIRDAMWAISNTSINQSNSPTISLTGCILIDNYKSIYVSNCSPVFDLWGNVFYTKNGLIPALTSPVYAGIQIDNCIGSTISGTGMNEFRDMRIGISTVRSELTIESDATIFQDFSGPPNQMRYAISADNYNSSLPFTLTKYGNSVIPDFENCDFGIYLYDCACDIRNNNFSRVLYGIYSVKAAHKSLRMTNNAISCLVNGISSISNIHPVYSLDIIENTISLFPQTSSQFNNGIRIDNYYSLSPDDHATIENNSVHIGWLGRCGIKLNNCIGYRVAENSVVLADCSTNQSGISITSGSDNLALCNSIVSSDPNWQSYPVATKGISAVFSPYGHIGFNETDQTSIGVYIDQNCANTDIYNHKFYDHNYGTYYSTSGITGDQYHNGNCWLGSYSPYALFENSPTTPSIYRIGTNACWPPSFWPPLIVVATGLIEATGVSPCSGGGASANALPVNGFTSLDTSVVAGQLSFSLFASASNWNAQRVLVRKIISDSVDVYSNTLMHSYLDSLKNESSGLFQILENEISSSILLSSNNKPQIRELFDSIETISQQISSIDAIIVNDTVALPSSNLLNVRSKLIAQSLVIEDNIQKEIGSHDSIFSTLIPQFLTLNSKLPDTGIYENNEKVLNNIYLSTFISGSELTTIQKQIILDIAEQCPISGGKAVYFARSIVSSFKDTTYNDEGKCIPSGNSKKQVINIVEPNNFTFYPNPASNSITIENEGNLEGRALFSIFDLSGKLVNSLNIQLDQKYTDIEVAALCNGMYTISIQYEGKQYNLGNLIINK